MWIYLSIRVLLVDLLVSGNTTQLYGGSTITCIPHSCTTCQWTLIMSDVLKLITEMTMILIMLVTIVPVVAVKQPLPQLLRFGSVFLLCGWRKQQEGQADRNAAWCAAMAVKLGRNYRFAVNTITVIAVIRMYASLLAQKSLWWIFVSASPFFVVLEILAQ